MNIFEIFLIAIGLSFDTFAVSVSSGLTISKIKFWQAFKIAVTLAFFQTLMPLIGWITGSQIENLIQNYDHWIAFGLLSLLGCKMVIEGLKNNHEEEKLNPLKTTVLIGMAIATSIDALVIGVSFAFIEINIYVSLLIIGVITFFSSMVGILIGKKVKGSFGNKMEILGGLILIAIGVKILISHVL
jgi:putative Mn2+ efflux pump MntP